MTNPTLDTLADYLGFQTHGDPALRTLLRAANDFLCDIRDKTTPRWLTILGQPDTGKTFLARQLVRPAVALLKSHAFDAVSHTFASWPNTVARLKSGDFEALDELITPKLLVLDDLGADQRDGKSEFTASQLSRLLDNRLHHWTIITSNLSRGSIWDIDPRINSRLDRDGNVVIIIPNSTPTFHSRTGTRTGIPKP